MDEVIPAPNSELKPKRGNPNLRKGGPSLNPSGKAKPIDQLELESLRTRVAELEASLRARESAESDPAGGVVTADRMRKVLGQDPLMDCGPTEKRLREWLKKDVAKYQAEIERRDGAESKLAEVVAENAVLKEKVADLEGQLNVMHEVRSAAVEDGGTKAALEKIERILAETHS